MHNYNKLHFLSLFREIIKFNSILKLLEADAVEAKAEKEALEKSNASATLVSTHGVNIKFCVFSGF